MPKIIVSLNKTIAYVKPGDSYLGLKGYVKIGSIIVMKDGRRGFISQEYPFISTDGFYHKLAVTFITHNNIIELQDINFIVTYSDLTKVTDEEIEEDVHFYSVSVHSNFYEQKDPMEDYINSISEEETKEKALKEQVVNNEVKPKFSLIPQFALQEVARVFTFGESKYQAYNYSKGENATVYVDAALRHINKYLMCKDVDDETNTNHLANATADLLMALDNIMIGKSNDNRNQQYKKIATHECTCEKCKDKCTRDDKCTCDCECCPSN